MSIFFFFSIALFISGVSGMFLSRQHLILILISLEIVLLSITFNFVMISVFQDDLLGQILSLLIFSIAAAETALGLAVLVVYYRLRGGIAVDLVNLLKS